MIIKKVFEVKLVKSLIGRKKRHKLCVLGLGLCKINDIVIVLDTPEIRGMLNKICYMIVLKRFKYEVE